MRRKKPTYLGDLNVRIDNLSNLRWQLQLTVVKNFNFSTTRENPAVIFDTVNTVFNEIEYISSYACSRKFK